MKKNIQAFIVFGIAVLVTASCAPTNAPALIPTVAAPIIAPTAVRATAAAIPTNVPPPTETSQPSPTPGSTKDKVTFKSGDLTLEGFLFKPVGQGPFPGVIWNHGSEQFPDKGQEFDSVASILVPSGYVVFAPVRRGQGESQGTYISDQVSQERKTKGDAAADQLMVDLMQTQQLDDQLAGLAYLKNLSYVDKNRLAVTGCSYGGIQTMLAAERGAGYRAAVAMSPGAESWNGSKPLQDRLIKAVSGINVPVFLIHPEKDVSVAPGYALAQEFLRLNKAYALKIYPPFGPVDEQGHCFGGAKGFHWWANDVLSFLGNALSPNPIGASQPPGLQRLTQPLKAEQVTLKSDGLNLVGYVYKPNGSGPFPGIIWNHGSEQSPTTSGEFDRIASIFVPAGYVVVDPVRRGQGGSQGDYIDDQYTQMVKSKGAAAANQFLVQQFEGPQLDDELAGLTYLKNLPYVDKNRLAVVGCSYGGMMTLLGAASGGGYKAGVALSPGAESWRNPAIQQMLGKAVNGINIPVSIIHPAHDASLEPGLTLGPQLQQLGKPYGLEIFPPFGTAVEHCFGGGDGGAVWGPEALTFLSNVLD